MVHVRRSVGRDEKGLWTAQRCCHSRQILGGYHKDGYGVDQRAWIVPTGAAFFDKPITDQSRIKIEFANRGKTPAWEVGQIDEIPVTLPYRRVGADQVPYIDDKSPAWPTKPLCTKDEIVPIGSVNPSQETYYVRHGARGNIPDLKKGGVIIVVRGCFVYRDAFGRRKSPYCFYSVPTRAGWGRIESQGIPRNQANCDLSSRPGGGWRGWRMGEALRIWVIKAVVEDGLSRNEAARIFRVGIASAIRWVKAFEEDAPRGGFAHRREPTFRAEAAPGLAPGTAA